MLTDLKSAKKVTGAKQVTRALKNGTARRVFLAQDADPRVTEPIELLCREQGTETEAVATMAALGLTRLLPASPRFFVAFNRNNLRLFLLK